MKERNNERKKNAFMCDRRYWFCLRQQKNKQTNKQTKKKRNIRFDGVDVKNKVSTKKKC